MKADNIYNENSGSNKLPKSLCVNPFTVPSTYFEDLAHQTLFLVKCELNFPSDKTSFTVPDNYFNKQASTLLTAIKLEKNLKKDTFSVAEDYFQTAADQIMSQVKIDELKNVESAIPSDYFKTLSTKILNRIEQAELSIEKKDTGFSLPADYFQIAQNNILGEIAAAQLKEKVNQAGFEVPTGYFDSLTNKINNQKEENKVIQLPAREPQKYRKIAWYSAVAAASIAAFIGFSTFYPENEPIVENEILSLNEIPEDEIINYLSKYSDASDLTYIAEYIYQPQDESKGIGSEVTNEVLEDYLNYTL